MDIKEFRHEYYFLSNFYNSSFQYKDTWFNNSEQAYQWEKAENDEDKKLILSCTTAKEAKRLGHIIKCDIEKWDSKKQSVMESILLSKFSGYYLRSKLIRTGDVNLIEGNYWHDGYWGICYCSKCSNIEGQNILGKILMTVRNKLKQTNF